MRSLVYLSDDRIAHRRPVSVVSGTVLPHLASRDRRLMAHKEDVDEDAELTRIRNTVHEWRTEAARKGRPLRLPVMPFLLRNIWTGAMLWFSLLTFSTFFITDVLQVFHILTLPVNRPLHLLYRHPYSSPS